jgi:nigerose phosphorylase
MDWIISETNQLSAQDADRLGSKMLTGNGFIGYRGTLEEFTKEQKTATIVSGLYDKVGDLWREPINLPNGGYIQVFYQGEPLHALTSKVIAQTQNLDIHSAVHERHTVFETADGTQITIHARRFASLSRRTLMCMAYTVRANRDCAIDIQAGIDGDVWDINGPHLEKLSLSEKDGILTLSGFTHEKAVPVAVSEVLAYQDQRQITEHQDLGKSASNGKILHKLHCRATQTGLTLYKFIAHVTGLDSPNPGEASQAACRQAAALGFDALLAEHSALWQQRWADCGITIEGDEAAQQALRFSMYHLLAIVPMHTQRASIPARGMSGQMYKGAIFWDTEIFMLPFFTHAFPDLARNLLLYRYHTLDGARRKAREYGFRGAYYAWESQDTGDDACTLFNVTDVFTNRPMRTYFRDKQVHISADVAYAFWTYYRATGDMSIWLEGGAEVVFECARFFLSYAYYNLDKRRYEILDVTGPDEYHERVHNNAFTNRLVAHTYEVCLSVAAVLQRESPAYLEELVAGLNLKGDLALIKEMANKIYLPDSGPAGSIIPQFDSYFTLEDLPLKTLLARKLHSTEYLGGGNGLATTTQIIKQADVVLMMFLFSKRYALETKRANWEFYEPRTEHGSSLSACSYSLIAAQIEKVDYAYQYFMKTATIDLTGEGKQYVGTLYIGGTHPAGNGGAWMSAVFGLCGIHWDGETLSINPHLPANWQRVRLPFMVRGQKVHISLTHEAISVKPVNDLTGRVVVFAGGKEHFLETSDGISITIPEPHG